ncbi:MAG: ubiquinone/menaquinone biosynthesis methyltransferase, partial [Gammaproteobacteria bacterium]|nr:ubiquinone/menaquinone biosynthesis methyltransferase [Gammaproteobacteria bacterium]
MNTDQQTTHFGFRQVDREQKTRLVRDVFDSVADRYDLMNDLMSLGIHRVWKHALVAHADVKLGQVALDVAAGTGDVSQRLASKVGIGGTVVSTDINYSMIKQGRDRLFNDGCSGCHFAQANAEQLPFGDDTFDVVTIAFGLRNVTDKDQALSSMLRVLKPGGRLVVLEFSKLKKAFLEPVYD